MSHLLLLFWSSILTIYCHFNPIIYINMIRFLVQHFEFLNFRLECVELYLKISLSYF